MWLALTVLCDVLTTFTCKTDNCVFLDATVVLYECYYCFFLLLKESCASWGGWVQDH